MTANTTANPIGDLESIRRTFKTINACVWAVAIGVMIYGIPIAYSLLASHGVPKGIAWMLSLLVDAALTVGLVATPVMARFGIPAGWVGALRWVSGLFTWALQTTGSWIAQDMIGVLLHSFGPVILFVVVEAASSFQRKMSAKIAEIEAAARDEEARHETQAREIASLRSQVASLTAQRADADAVRVIAEKTAAEADALRAALDEAEAKRIADLEAVTASLTARHDEEVRRLAERHREALARARAEAGAVRLDDYRRKGSSKTPAKSITAGSSKTGNQPAMSDEEAVQAMLGVSEDPSYEWAKAEVRRVTGAGFGARMDRLIATWREAASRGSSGRREEVGDDADEERAS